MNKTGFSRADILIPRQDLLDKWCVVACDQYTSEPAYWEEVAKNVGDAPSAFHITFPEIYLKDDDADERIASINRTMKKYLKKNIFTEYKNSFVYTERTLDSGAVRAGLMGAIDLEEYDFSKGSETLVRATEGTVVERIPPRVKIRRNAPIESPHIMVLIDDSEGSVIEPLADKKDKLKKVYSADLMLRGGKVEGWLVDDKEASRIEAALLALAGREAFERKYDVKDKGVLLFAMGDGNHSLATAKQCYENLKEEIGAEAASRHPARFALVEVVNLHSKALNFEPIHRVLFGVDTGEFVRMMTEALGLEDGEGEQSFTYIINEKPRTVRITKPTSKLCVGSLQNFLDAYTASRGGEVDYIHGKTVVRLHAKKPENVGFILPEVHKRDLFPTVISDGALPRKTFSMGEAWDKRYYLECRKIK
ncbi:MAG: DUF1015 domain-containing protein [Clostridia bacterium]|nr:DUF1015 domain-containing protein [Clostridia bacterium]